MHARPMFAAAVSALLISGAAHAGNPVEWWHATTDAVATGYHATATWACDTHQRAVDAANDAWNDALLVAHDSVRSTHGVRVWTGESWQRPAANDVLPQRVVLLVHGLDESGAIWDDAAPALSEAGLRVVRFDYANDQPIADSALDLREALRRLHAGGVRRVDILAHSMGGLVSRDLLSRPDGYAGDARGSDTLPAVSTLTMAGTPNRGAPLARFQPLMEARDHAERWWAHESKDPRVLLGFLADGRGEAGCDLLPDSAFLRELNARPLTQHVEIVLVSGEMGEALRDAAAWLPTPASAGVQAAIGALGDGAVPTDSAIAVPGATVIETRANHRTLLRRCPGDRVLSRVRGESPETPPAVRAVIDRLAPAPGVVTTGDESEGVVG
ncbi:MAG: alpha/beta fold hydrolase [Planctomycetota bacterium]